MLHGEQRGSFLGICVWFVSCGRQISHFFSVTVGDQCHTLGCRIL
jgi:hypothetical protein